MFDFKKIPFFDALPMGVCKFSTLKENLIQCRAVSRIPEKAESVIVVLFPYYLGEEYYIERNISKYAVPADYHKVCGEYLEKITTHLKAKYKENQFVYFCDNSPINEVKAACLAGVGVKGDNSLLINEIYGSFCFIGEIVTDLKIEVNAFEEKSCLKCGACKLKCHCEAISECGVIKEKCLSEITQKKGELTAEEGALVLEGGSVWGCDVCQDVCPMNRNVKPTPIKEFFANAKPNYKNSCDYKEDRAFYWRKQDVIERNLRIITKNNYCKNDKNQL